MLSSPRVRLALVLVFGAGCFAWGFLAHRNHVFPYGLLKAFRDEATGGVFVPTEDRSPVPDLLSAVPYVGSTFDPNPERSGVFLHEPDRTWRGLNLHTSMLLGRAFLRRMDGSVVHEWKVDEGEFRHAHLLDDGGVLALLTDRALVRLDRDSNVAWSFPARAHHDLDIDAEGNIHVLVRRDEVVPAVHPDRPTVRDEVVVLTPDGEEVRRIDLLDSMLRSPWAALLPDAHHRLLGMRERAVGAIELLHPNHVEVLDGRHADRAPFLAQGNLLVCHRNISAVVVLDGRTGDVLWLWGPSNLTLPHHPSLTDAGTLLVFNNGVDASEVLELDPVARRVVWRWGPGTEFFSALQGGAQRLPNGNTLITESDPGYAHEVTPDGEVVWSFANPVIDDEQKREVIWRMVRLPADAPGVPADPR